MVRGVVRPPDYWHLDDVQLQALVEASNDHETQTHKFRRFLSAMIAAEVRNTMRYKQTDRVWTAHDFMPREVKQLTPEQVAKLFKGWVQAQGGKVIDERAN